LCLYGQDIDPLAVARCKVNGALYAPWLSFPLPEAVVGTHAKPPPASLPVPEPAIKPGRRVQRGPSDN
jgi:hypothetical protein